MIFPHDNGEVRIEVKDEPKDWVERILEKIIDGTLGTVRDIAATARQTLKGNQVTDANGTPVSLGGVSSSQFHVQPKVGEIGPLECRWTTSLMSDL